MYTRQKNGTVPTHSASGMPVANTPACGAFHLSTDALLQLCSFGSDDAIQAARIPQGGSCNEVHQSPKL